MVSPAADFILKHKKIFEDYELSNKNKTIVEVLLRPTKFSDFIKTNFESKYKKEEFLVNNLVNLINNQARIVVKSNVFIGKVKLSACSRVQ